MAQLQFKLQDKYYQDYQIPVRPTNQPIPAVIATPKAPPRKILVIVLTSGDAAILAEIYPAATKPIAVNIRIALT